MKYALLIILSFIFPALAFAESMPVVGGDRDQYGCIGSAGYSWSPVLEKCIRPFEHYTLDIENRPVTGMKRLDFQIKQREDQVLREFQRNAEEAIRDMSGDTLDPSRYTLDISYEKSSTGRFLSVKMYVYTYLGGAHGSTTLYTWNFDTLSKKPVPLSNLLTSNELVQVGKNAEEFLQEYYTAQKFPLDPEWLREGTDGSNRSNYQTFSLLSVADNRPKSLVIYYADYQVGPYAIGMPSLRVDLESLAVSAP